MLTYLFSRETCIVTFLLGGINCVRSTRSMPTGEVSSIFFFLLTEFYFLVPESLIKKSRFLVWIDKKSLVLVLKKLTMFGSLRRANRMVIETVLSKFRSMPHYWVDQVHFRCKDDNCVLFMRVAGWTGYLWIRIHLICQIRMEVSYCTSVVKK